jgi:hypothetical protein
MVGKFKPPDKVCIVSAAVKYNYLFYFDLAARDRGGIFGGVD